MIIKQKINCAEKLPTRKTNVEYLTKNLQGRKAVLT